MSFPYFEGDNYFEGDDYFEGIIFVWIYILACLFKWADSLNYSHIDVINKCSKTKGF